MVSQPPHETPPYGSGPVLGRAHEMPVEPPATFVPPARSNAALSRPVATPPVEPAPFSELPSTALDDTAERDYGLADTTTADTSTGQITAVAAAVSTAFGRGGGVQLSAQRIGGGALTAPNVPPRSPTTTPDRTVRGGSERARRRSRLHIGAHVVTPAALDQVTVPALGTGVLVGADQDRQPVLIRVFRAQPTSIVLVGSAWAAQLLSFRALAVGAQVFATTANPAAWEGLGARAVGERGIQASTMDSYVLPPGMAESPILAVREAGYGSGPLGPWQTRLTVLTQLDAADDAVVRSADLVLMQRLTAPDAQRAAQALGLHPRSADALATLEPEMLALVGNRAEHYVWLQRTAIEHELLGAPQR